MNDSYECTVLVPHKDTLFLLSKAQKSIILEYNKTHQKENYLLPSYPLWGKLDEQVFKVQNKIKITDASLTGPFVEKTKAFFYFKVSTKDKRYTSPKPPKPSKAAKLRKGKESGEYIEQLLLRA